MELFRKGLPVLAVSIAVSAGQLQAQEMPAYEVDRSMLSEKYKGKSYSPYASRDFPNEVLWGDSHLHTGISFDAGTAGATLLPEDAYRFARGEEVVSSYDIPVKLSRPLDWLAVTDHTDNMGFIVDLAAGKPNILATPQGRDWHERLKTARKDDKPEIAYDIIKALMVTKTF
ncbi:MAG: DUF3604 domain-containing protein, partial [Halioglobus sp.]